MKPLVTMRQAVEDPALLGSMLDGPSWAVWRALLIASRGEPLTDEELALYTARTGRLTAPTEPVDEAAFIAGRRSGKTVSAACLALYLAALCDWSDVLSRGERGVLLFLAQSQRTAKVAFRYAEAAFKDVPMLKGLVANITQDTISLTNGIDLEIRPASFRGLRGITSVGVIADEIAFWYTDEGGANPDVEVLAALRPALATTGGPVLMISSPYGRAGELWETFRRDYGPDGDPRVLVAQGASRDFNDTLPQSVVDRALERDRARFTAEYLGQFRDDVTTFIPEATVRRCIDTGVLERKPDLRRQRYVAFTDPSGGVSDSMTLAIAHVEGQKAILDCIREIHAPFSPSDACDQFGQLLRLYGCTSVTGDRFGGQWVEEAFRSRSISYFPSELVRSDIYLNALPMLSDGAVRLLDSDRLVRQMTALERKTGRNGKDAVDHPRNGKDDVANAVCGALVMAREGIGGASVEEQARQNRMMDEAYGRNAACYI